MNPNELMRYRQTELRELFSKLPAPASDKVDGMWSGKLMAFSGLGWLPRWFASALYRVLALPFIPWRGKGFGNGEGANRWFGLPGVGYGAYHLKFIDSPLDGKPVLRLDYDRKDNLFIFRRIRGEGRVLAENQMLCRMLWQTRSGLHTVLYFTLSRKD